ncbi:MAG: putative dehydratase/racemase [Pseudonocardiales bacterium]|nr:putative dehydratase/racemase [Pseudonocardiales bacterium]
MTGVLDGLRIVEGSAFIAAPLGGMTLAQLGADVIRFDQIGGGLDYGRWPLAPDGQSLFWAGMNKGKRSIQLDLRSREGQELAAALVTAPGEDAGLFLTNFPPRGWMDPSRLTAARPDLVMVVISGNADGSSEVDYTVNPATGFPLATGPRGLNEPVNSLLPAWDIACGNLAAVGLLAGERKRRRTGEGSVIPLALSDVAFAMTGHMGRIAQAHLGQGTPAKDGNYLYGAYGNDFATRDGRRVMVVGLTARQWSALVEVTALASSFEALTAEGHDLMTEGGRYVAREAITAVLAPWFAARDLVDVEAAFAGTGVAAGVYRTFEQMLDEDDRVSTENRLFQGVNHPGVGAYLMPGSPLRFPDAGTPPPSRAPLLGEHTDEILAGILGLDAAAIGRLHDAGVVAGAA